MRTIAAFARRAQVPAADLPLDGPRGVDEEDTVRARDLTAAERATQGAQHPNQSPEHR